MQWIFHTENHHTVPHYLHITPCTSERRPSPCHNRPSRSRGHHPTWFLVHCDTATPCHWRRPPPGFSLWINRINKNDSFQTFKPRCTEKWWNLKSSKLIFIRTILITSAVSAACIFFREVTVVTRQSLSGEPLTQGVSERFTESSSTVDVPLHRKPSPGSKKSQRRNNVRTWRRRYASPLNLGLFYNHLLHFRMIENDRFVDFMYFVWFLWFWLLFNWWFPSGRDARLQFSASQEHIGVARKWSFWRINGPERYPWCHGNRENAEIPQGFHGTGTRILKRDHGRAVCKKTERQFHSFLLHVCWGSFSPKSSLPNCGAISNSLQGA